MVLYSICSVYVGMCIYVSVYVWGGGYLCVCEFVCGACAHTCVCACMCACNTVGDTEKFRIPFRRTAVARLKNGGGNGTPFVKKRPFRSTALPF